MLLPLQGGSWGHFIRLQSRKWTSGPQGYRKVRNFHCKLRLRLEERSEVLIKVIHAQVLSLGHMQCLHTQFCQPLQHRTPGLKFQFLSLWEALFLGWGPLNTTPWSLHLSSFSSRPQTHSSGFQCYRLCCDSISVQTAAPWGSANFENSVGLPSEGLLLAVTHISWMKTPVLCEVYVIWSHSTDTILGTSFLS